MGLKPIVRRVWSPRGVRPVAIQRRRYKWLYVYTFVRPDTGESYWLLLPTVSTEAFSIALEEFAKHVGCGPDRHIALVLDGAGWHTSKKLRVPEGMHLVFQPPYSPELQPVERVWTLLNEPIANRPFRDLDELEDVAGRRCRELMADPILIQRHTLFHWWKEAL